MNTTGKHSKNVQRSMKEFTSSKIKSNKRPVSQRSPPIKKQVKKARYPIVRLEGVNVQSPPTMSNTNDNSSDELKQTMLDKPEQPESDGNTSNHHATTEVKNTPLEGALGPLVHQIQLLRETFDDQFTKLDDKYTKLETVIMSQKKEMSQELNKLRDSISNQKVAITTSVNEKIDKSEAKIEKVLQENVSLKKSNAALQERLSRIETSQLDNNVILTGIQEQQWEKFEITRQRVIDVIAEALHGTEDENALLKAQQVSIAKCRRIGKYRMNFNRPISITFQCRDDKDLLMSNKHRLPAGIYANDEYPIHVKQTRDRLRPLLRYAKSLPEYRDNCKLIGDKIMINGLKYGIDELHRLQPGLEAYRAAQRMDDDTIAFHGELSPYSNFHPSPFMINGHTYHSAEQWIQYTKSMMFGDSYTANLILRCDNALEAKKLSHQINGVDHNKWRLEGYEACFPGLKENFLQNPPLKSMLNTTKPKLLVEASTDHLWGTGIGLRDVKVLNKNCWSGHGWLSNMLHDIRDQDG